MTSAALPLMQNNSTEHNLMANALRFLAIDAVNAASSGHPGMPMGLADVATALFHKHLNYNPQEPNWLGRDRFILSNGHGSMLQYALLHLTGYDLPLDELKNFRQFGSKTAGHPEYGHTVGVETTTGPLGQGFANAVGMALGEKMMAAKLGGDEAKTLYNHKIYTVVGDGCLMEGLSHEAAEFAGHMQLDNLIVLFDDNGISIDGKTELSVSTDHFKRMEGYGFATYQCNGHDEDEIDRALIWAKKQTKPVFIACKTQIGFGSPNMVDTAKAHGSPLGDDEASATRKALGWSHEPFHIPKDIYHLWQTAAQNGQRHYQLWQDVYNKLSGEQKSFMKNGLQTPQKAIEALKEVASKACQDRPTLATRKASGNCIDVLAEHMPYLVSGSADLTGSNNTQAKNAKSVTPADKSGNYIHYGVREHGMAAIMNGLALYGGQRIVSGTFLTFLDYLKPALRLAALMELPVIHVLTHDSIGLGEDGPTHQPIEHLASLRATPNVLTLRPCDQVEAAECWQLALQNTTGPTALILSRQGVPTLRLESGKNLSATGAYIMRKEQGELKGILFASGTEVELAVKAHENLAAEGIHTRVVSVPSLETFLRQDKEVREEIVPSNVICRVAIEAASPLGWDSLLGFTGKFIGMTSFGASAPADELYKHFGITAQAAADAIKEQLS